MKHSSDIREKLFGSQHLEVDNSISSMASLYRDQGRYAEVEKLFLLLMHL